MFHRVQTVLKGVLLSCRILNRVLWCPAGLGRVERIMWLAFRGLGVWGSGVRGLGVQSLEAVEGSEASLG